MRLTTRLILLAACGAPVAHADVAPVPVDDYAISIAARDDVVTRRAALLQFIWGSAGLPATRSERVARRLPLPVAGLPNVARVEKLRSTLPRSSGAPVVVSAFHFIPKRGNGRVVIFENGHGCPATFDENGKGYGMNNTIRALLAEGFAVAAVFMPLQSDEQCEPKQHGALFGQSPAGRNGLAFFLEPTAQTLNYLLQHYRYRDVSLIGFSGGGWATTVYAALDPRVRTSIPVAGSVPLYLRKAEYSHDEEQFHAPFYSLVGYPDLYVMGSSGPGRRQVQVLNRNDPCCFSSVFHDPTLPHVAELPEGRRDFESAVRAYEARVQAVLAKLGEGSFLTVVDEQSRHTVSDETIANVILPALRGVTPQ